MNSLKYDSGIPSQETLLEYDNRRRQDTTRYPIFIIVSFHMMSLVISCTLQK